MATIKIDDTLRPTRSNDNPPYSGVGGGVYSARNISRDSVDKRSIGARTRSIDRRSLRSGNNERVEDEDSGLRQAGDFKKRQV
jgi:KUP system potassium uptake protein